MVYGVLAIPSNQAKIIFQMLFARNKTTFRAGGATGAGFRSF
jgi:hypothetical protein